jgi:hypothetical protein
MVRHPKPPFNVLDKIGLRDNPKLGRMRAGAAVCRLGELRRKRKGLSGTFRIFLPGIPHGVKRKTRRFGHLEAVKRKGKMLTKGI